MKLHFCEHPSIQKLLRHSLFQTPILLGHLFEEYLNRLWSIWIIIIIIHAWLVTEILKFTLLHNTDNNLKNILRFGVLIWIDATKVLGGRGVGELLPPVQWMLVPFNSTVAFTTINVDIIGKEALTESLVTLNECPFTTRGNVKKDVDKTRSVRLCGVPDWKTVTFHYRSVKLVLHLKEGWVPGQTDSSPEGVNIT